MYFCLFYLFYGRLSGLQSVSLYIIMYTELLIPPGSLFCVESRIASMFLTNWHQAVQRRWGGHSVPTVHRVSRKPLLHAPSLNLYQFRHPGEHLKSFWFPVFACVCKCRSGSSPALLTCYPLMASSVRDSRYVPSSCYFESLFIQ